jgi:hypothetical protein
VGVVERPHPGQNRARGGSASPQAGQLMTARL